MMAAFRSASCGLSKRIFSGFHWSTVRVRSLWINSYQETELARIRQEEVLFSAPEAAVDDDVSFADLGVPETVYPWFKNLRSF